MNISQRGIDLIKKFEGLRTTAYLDAVGVWTIGYGHTKTAKKDMKISEEEAEILLKEDLDWAVNAVNRNLKIKVMQSQFDALVSFTFNLGETNLKRSYLLSMTNDGDFNAAAKEFKRWVYADGKKLAGLVKRRQEERELYVSGLSENKGLSPWQVTARHWAMLNNISNGERPLEPVSRVEVMEMMRKYNRQFGG